MAARQFYGDEWVGKPVVIVGEATGVVRSVDFLTGPRGHEARVSIELTNMGGSPNVSPEELRQTMARQIQDEVRTKLLILDAITRGGGPERHTDWQYVADTVSRLAWLLGLADQERAFISAAIDADGFAARCDELLVFADWLEDNARDAHASRIRKLVPESGDLLVAYLPEGLSGYELDMAARSAVAALDAVCGRLRVIGREVTFVVLPHGYSVQRLESEDMARLGWVRNTRWSEQQKEIEALKAENARLKRQPLLR